MRDVFAILILIFLARKLAKTHMILAQHFTEINAVL
jgi:hypothetical protein